MSKPEDIYMPPMAAQGPRGTVVIMTTDKTEDLEFFYPYYRFVEAGYRVDVVTPKGKGFEGKQGLGLQTSGKIAEAKASAYDLLFIPGGKAPAALKDNDDALGFVKAFAASGKPIASICHGPQVLAAADVIRGRKISAWPDVQAEVEEAGATYLDREALTDGAFTTARWPADLPVYMREVLSVLEKSKASSHFRGAA